MSDTKENKDKIWISIPEHGKFCIEGVSYRFDKTWLYEDDPYYVTFFLPSGTTYKMKTSREHLRKILSAIDDNVDVIDVG